jgi:hypothetical protein
MDVLFLFFFFGFIAFAIWLGYVGYRVMLKKRKREQRTIGQDRNKL